MKFNEKNLRELTDKEFEKKDLLEDKIENLEKKLLILKVERRKRILSKYRKYTF